MQSFDIIFQAGYAKFAERYAYTHSVVLRKYSDNSSV